VTTLTFTRTYYAHPSIWESVLPDGNLWSLNVEEQCYVILATIAVIRPLRTRAALVLFGLAALTLPAIKLHMRFAVPGGIPYLLTTECASGGLFLAAGYQLIARNWKMPAWSPVAALCAACVCYFGFRPWYLPLTAAPVLLAFSVNHIQQSWKWAVRSLEWRPLRQLGVLSYSVYLWQQLFLQYRADFPYHSGVALALCLGALSYYLFEKPARTWLNAHWGRSGLSERVASAPAGS